MYMHECDFIYVLKYSVALNEPFFSQLTVI